MNTRLFEAFSELDQDLLDRSEEPVRHKKRRVFGTAALAAAALLAAAVLVTIPRLQGPEDSDIQGPDPGTGVSGPSEPGQEAQGPGVVEPGPEQTEPGEQKPGQNEPQIGEEEPPPELRFNEAAAAPMGNVPAFEETPMSAWQLELSWSMDCPTAFLEEGEADRWFYWSNLSGHFVWDDQGDLLGLRLVYRREEDPVPALVTVTPADRPLASGCVLPEEAVESAIGPLRCTAWRLELGDTVRLGADFTIGDVLYAITADAALENETAAENVLYTAVSVMQMNALVGRTPDLTSFERDDPTSGRLTGENTRPLLSLSGDPDKEGRVLVYRDGRVVYLRPGLTERDAVPLGTLSRDAFWEIRELPYGGEQGGEGVTLTLYDPWGREATHFTGRLTGQIVQEVTAILEREGLMPSQGL